VHGLILLIDVISEQVLDSRVLREGNMGTQIEDKFVVIAEGGRVAPIVAIFVVHRRRDALAVKTVSRTEPSHSSTKYYNIWHLLALPSSSAHYSLNLPILCQISTTVMRINWSFGSQTPRTFRATEAQNFDTM
jgi:hypothetical protein